MRGKTKNFLCGRCDTAVETVANPKPHDVVSCPKCGNSDTFKNVIRIVNEGIKEAAAIHTQKSLKKVTAGSKGLKVSGPIINKRKRRFQAPLLCQTGLVASENNGGSRPAVPC